MRTSSCPACRPRASRSPRRRSRLESSPSTSHSAAACEAGLSRLASPRPQPRSPRPTHAARMCTRELTRAPRPNSQRARTRPNPNQVSELRRGRGRAGQPRARGGQGHHRHARAQPAPAARQLPRAVDTWPRSGARRASRGCGRRRGRGAASCSRAAVALIEACGSRSGFTLRRASFWPGVLPKAVEPPSVLRVLAGGLSARVLFCALRLVRVSRCRIIGPRAPGFYGLSRLVLVVFRNPPLSRPSLLTDML